MKATFALTTLFLARDASASTTCAGAKDLYQQSHCCPSDAPTQAQLNNVCVAPRMQLQDLTGDWYPSFGKGSVNLKTATTLMTSMLPDSQQSMVAQLNADPYGFEKGSQQFIPSGVAFVDDTMGNVRMTDVLTRLSTVTASEMYDLIPSGHALILNPSGGLAYTTPQVGFNVSMGDIPFSAQEGYSWVFYLCSDGASIFPTTPLGGRLVDGLPSMKDTTLSWPAEGLKVLASNSQAVSVGSSVTLADLKAAHPTKTKMVFNYEATWCPSCAAAISGPNDFYCEEATFKVLMDFLAEHVPEALIVNMLVTEAISTSMQRVMDKYSAVFGPLNVSKPEDRYTFFNNAFGQTPESAEQFVSFLMMLQNEDGTKGTANMVIAEDNPLKPANGLTDATWYNSIVPGIYVEALYGTYHFKEGSNTHHMVYDVITETVALPKQGHFGMSANAPFKYESDATFFAALGRPDLVPAWQSYPRGPKAGECANPMPGGNYMGVSGFNANAAGILNAFQTM